MPHSEHDKEPYQFSSQTKEAKEEKKKQQRYMNDPEINKESSRVVFKTRKCMVHNKHT